MPLPEPTNVEGLYLKRLVELQEEFLALLKAGRPPVTVTPPGATDIVKEPHEPFPHLKPKPKR